MSRLAATFVLLTTVLISHSVEALAQSITSTYPLLPATERDLKFERYLSRLDLEDTARYEFHKKTGGTSHGFKISRRGKRKKALFLPKNSATHLEGEVVSYRLSRLLGVSRIFNPVDYYELGPKAIARFRPMIDVKHKNKWRRINARSINARLARDPKSLPGIIKYRHKRRSQPLDRLSSGNGLKRSHALAILLRAENRQPENRLISLRGIRRDKKTFPHPQASELELVRQLSTILVVDSLTAQGDRFSGGNIEVYAHKDGQLQFVARDNGGATLEGRWSWYKKYMTWVSRFDRSMVQRLMQLNEFLQERRATFAGFTSVEQLSQTLGFRHKPGFVTFRKKLRHFAEENVPSLARRFGNKIYFPDLGEVQIASVDPIASRTGVKVLARRQVAELRSEHLPQPKPKLRVAKRKATLTQRVRRRADDKKVITSTRRSQKSRAARTIRKVVTRSRKDATRAKKQARKKRNESKIAAKKRSSVKRSAGNKKRRRTQVAQVEYRPKKRVKWHATFFRVPKR